MTLEAPFPVPLESGVLHRIVEDVLRPRASDYIRGLPQDVILGTPVEDVVRDARARFGLHVPVLGEPRRLPHVNVPFDTTNQPGVHMRTPGTRRVETGVEIRIEIPYEGDANLFEFVRRSVPLQARNGALFLSFATLDMSPERVNATLVELVDAVRTDLDAIRAEAAEWNDRGLPQLVGAIYGVQRKRFHEIKHLTDSLRYPLKLRPDAGAQEVPIKPRAIALDVGSPRPGDAAPQYAIEMSAYDEVLRILSNMALAVERSPSIFRKAHEGELRDFMLVMLNAVFEGQATGETFNRGGKADIIVRVDNRNVFVAECKIWGGPKTLTEGLDQLLERYAYWRDNRLAVILFSRNQDFNAVVQAIVPAMRAHPSCVRHVEDFKSDTAFRFLVRPKDQGRDMVLTVMACDVGPPANEETQEPSGL